VSEAPKKVQHSMEYRFLGKSGLRVSVLSFGAWVTAGSQINDDAFYECTKAAIDAGCNFLDNAEVYADGQAELSMGRVLKRLNIDRSELVIATKIYWGGPEHVINARGLSRKHIIEGMNKSLKRLDLEYVDLVFCHRPDIHTPIEETVRAMNFLIDHGKAFYWGTSEWAADQIVEAHRVANLYGLIGPTMEQPQYSMLHRTRVEREYSRIYPNQGLGLTVWSPLASGLLTGKYTSTDPSKFPAGSRLSSATNEDKMAWLRNQLLSGNGMNGLEERDLEVILKKVAGLKPIAERLGCSIAQLAIAWCVKNPNVSTVITGASSVQQVVENFKSLEVVPKLTPEVLKEIEEVLQNKPKEWVDWYKH